MFYLAERTQLIFPHQENSRGRCATFVKMNLTLPHMNKLFAFLLLILLSEFSSGQKVFARIEKDHFIIVQDSTAFKKSIKQKLFAESEIQPLFAKIEIRRQMTIGETSEEFYYVLLQDFNSKIKVAKWLIKSGFDLMLDDDKSSIPIERTYLSCIGERNCFPQIAILNSEKFWACSTDFICKPNSGCQKLETIYSKD